jgi:hypothetical protein
MGEGWAGASLAPALGLQTPAQHQGLKEPRWNKAQAVENLDLQQTPALYLVISWPFSTLQLELGVEPGLLPSTRSEAA